MGRLAPTVPHPSSRDRTSIGCSWAEPERTAARRPPHRRVRRRDAAPSRPSGEKAARPRSLTSAVNGGPTPLICSPLVGRTRAALAEAANVVAKKPDVIEWRVDYFEGIADAKVVVDVAGVLRETAGDMPIIFTRRSVKGRGKIAIGDEEVRLYDAVGAAGSSTSSTSMGNDPAHVRECAEHARAGRGSSFHFLVSPGEFLVGASSRRAARRRRGGDATRSGRRPDALRRDGDG